MPDGRGELVWRLAETTAIPAFGILPTDWRFAAAVRFARLLERVNLPRERYRMAAAGRREAALNRVLVTLMRRRIAFKPVISVHGVDEIPREGALGITAHFGLGLVLLKWLVERDQQLKVTLVITKAPIRGVDPRSPERVLTIGAGPRVLLQARSHIAAGRLTVIALDRPRPRQGLRPMEGPERTIFLSDSPIRFAEMTRVPIIFLASRLDANGGVVATVSRPNSTSAEEIYEEFVSFVRSQMEQMTF